MKCWGGARRQAFGQEDRRTERFFQRSPKGCGRGSRLLVAREIFNLMRASIRAGIAALLFIGVHDIQGAG